MKLRRYLRHLFYTLTGLEVYRLNLRLRWADAPDFFYDPLGYLSFFSFWRPQNMAKIGDRFTATISPTNAAGAAAPVTDISFVELTDQYDIESITGNVAVFVAVKAGPESTVAVTALSKAGVTLSASGTLPAVDVPVDEEAVALNLTVVAA